MPIGNTLENWARLQRMHVPSRLLVWPDVWHWILKAQDSRHFYDEVHAWLATDELIHSLTHRELPKQWNSVPHSATTQAKGDAWLRRAKHLALRVPSVHSQHDWTVLINPGHQAAQQVKAVARRAYKFDPHLFER